MTMDMVMTRQGLIRRKDEDVRAVVRHNQAVELLFLAVKT